MTAATGYGSSIVVSPTLSQIIVTTLLSALTVTGSAPSIVVTQNLFTDTE